MKPERGFSLVELLIVVLVILIIAAIAIPNLVRSKIAANEASAITTCRTINSAEATFAATYKSGFTDTLRRLGTPTGGAAPDVNNADLLDPTLSASSAGNVGATGFVKSGYIFLYAPVGNTTFGFIPQYSLNADPEGRGSTGQRSFYTDQALVIRANPGARATSSDNPI